MLDDVITLGSAIDEAYRRLQSVPETERALAERAASEYGELIVAVAAMMKKSPATLLSEWSEETIASYFELATLPLLVSDSVEQHALFQDLVQQLEVILESQDIQKLKQGAKALIESLMLIIENVDQHTSQLILQLLAKLSNAPEGVIPPSKHASEQVRSNIRDSGVRASLRGLLHVGLYREVMIFLKQREDVNRARDRADALKHILTPTVSFASRKGGVGKSMMVFATAAWFLKIKPGARVCIIDLDLSGPVWQYLLFPERDKPSHFLNDLINLEQGNQKGDFTFPDVSTEEIKSLLEESTIRIEGTPLYLLTVADLPRTSRYLSVAIANNSEYWFNFLTQLISALQPLVDLVVIDNPPGLDSLPLLSHILATSIPCGCSAIISTPALPDLRGTTIELSDLYVLDRESSLVYRPPLWIVNKADEKAREFLLSEHNIMELAFQVDSYNRILPARHVVLRAVTPSTEYFQGIALPLDPKLLAFSNIKNDGTPPLQDALKTFLQTAFFEAFVETVGPAVIPYLTPAPKHGTVSDA